MEAQPRILLNKLLGLRGRLMLLVLLSLGPALVLVGFLGWSQVQHAQSDATDRVAHEARLVALEYASELRRARQALLALAALEELRNADPEVCARALIGPQEMDRAILALGVTDAQGNVLCSAPGTPHPQVDERPVILRAGQDEGVVLGPYRYANAWRRGVVTVALLLPPSEAVTDRVLYAVVDPLGQIEELVAAAAVPEGAVTAVLDAQRRVLRRYPDPARLQGQIAPEAEVLWRKGRDGVEARGLDGINRLWAFATLEQNGPTNGSYVHVGVPADVVLAPVRAQTRNALIALLLAALALLGVVWILGGRLLVKPVIRLGRMTRAVADGDLARRSGLQHEGGELGELARDFDRMAARLAEQFQALDDARQEAQRNETLFRAVAEQSACGILLYEGEKVRFVNRVVERMTGRPQEELLGMRPWEMVRPDHQQFIIDRMTRRMAGGPVDDVIEFPLATADGAERWVGSAGTRIVVDGQPGALITWWDITARRQAERLAREGEAALRAVMDSVFSIILIHRGERLIYVNASLVQATGRSREDLLSMHFADLFVPEDRIAIHERALRRLRGEEAPNRYEARLQHKDGSYRWVEVGGTLIDYFGAPAILGNCHDITESRQAREMIEQVLQGNPSPTFVLDAEHRVRYWNGACESAFDMPAADIIGTREQWRPFYALERPVLADIVLSGATGNAGEMHYAGKKLRQSTFAKSAYEAEDFFPQFGARGMWLHFTAAPLKDSEGKVIGAIETLQDVTSRRLVEDELRQTKQNLEVLVQKRTSQLAQAKEALEADNTHRQEVERVLLARNAELTELNLRLSEAQEQLLQSEKLASIGQLAAGVAHEINNPIGYVHSNLGSLGNYIGDLFGLIDQVEKLVSELPESAALRQRVTALREQFDLAYLKEDLPALLEESKEGITRVKKIVQDLKDFSRVDSSQEWQMADLHAGIDSTLNIVRNEIKYKAEVVKAYGELPPVECLPSQLNQVFMNLLVNAAHAMSEKERGTITVRTGRAEAEKEVWVEVADDGCGIAPENLKRIFDPFFTTKPVGKGTGLGLSLAYGIVQKHHGRIEVQSTVGQGTSFRVCLPVSQARMATAEPETTT